MLGDWVFGCSEIYSLNTLDSLQDIEIGDDCFGSVQTFKIDGLNRLQSLKIGINSFTQVKYNGFVNDSDGSISKCRNEWKSFHILNCESLESIEIGEYSFSDFAGEFELRNLPQLQSIQIGIIGRKSYNFFGSSFVIRITLGDYAFCFSLSTIMESIE